MRGTSFQRKRLTMVSPLSLSLSLSLSLEFGRGKNVQPVDCDKEFQPVNLWKFRNGGRRSRGDRFPSRGCVYLAGAPAESSGGQAAGRGLIFYRGFLRVAEATGWPTAKMVMQSSTATAVVHESHFSVFTFHSLACSFSFWPNIWSEKEREREREKRDRNKKRLASREG